MVTESNSAPWAVITGASSGIGSATARHFAERGYSVALIARRADRLTALSEELTASFGAHSGASFPVITADLSTDEGIDHAVRALSDLKIAVLIHNAGMIQPISSMMEISRAQWRTHMTLNVEAPLFMTQALADQLRGGKVIHISSGAAHKSIAGWGAYCVSKAALYRVWASFKDELAERGVTLASVRPGVVDTEMQEVIRDADHPSFVQRPYFEELKRQGQLLSPKQAGAYIYQLCTELSPEELSAKEWDIRD